MAGRDEFLNSLSGFPTDRDEGRVFMKILPEKNVLSLKTRVSYGLGEYVYTYTLMVFMTYFVFFLTDVIGIGAATAGTIYLIGMIWDAVTDPVLGYVGDTVKWKSGRRRTPFMKLAIVPVCVFTILMFVVVDLGGTGTKVYYALMAVLFYTSATTYYISYQALGAEMTSDLDQRASMMTIRSGILSLATALASAGTYLLLSVFTNLFQSESAGWFWSVTFWCATGFVLAIMSIKGTKGYERIMPWGTEYARARNGAATPPEGHAGESLVGGIVSTFRNKPFLYTIGVMLTCCVAGYGSSSILIYYMTYYMNLSDLETTWAFALTGIAGTVTLFVADRIMQKFERKVAYGILIGGFILSFVILLLSPPGDKPLFYLAMILWGYGWMCLWALIYTLIADATVVEEYMTGKQKEGTYYGIVQLGLKIGSGVMIWITGMVLEGSGYVANVQQSEQSLSAIRFMNSVVPGVMMVVSIVLMIFYPLNREIYAAIVSAIERKKAGLPYTKVNGLNVGGGKIAIEKPAVKSE